MISGSVPAYTYCHRWYVGGILMNPNMKSQTTVWVLHRGLVAISQRRHGNNRALENRHPQLRAPSCARSYLGYPRTLCSDSTQYDGYGIREQHEGFGVCSVLATSDNTKNSKK